jgi:hypothetical protein
MAKRRTDNYNGQKKNRQLQWPKEEQTITIAKRKKGQKDN